MGLLEERDVARVVGKAMRGLTVEGAGRIFGVGVNGIGLEYKVVRGGDRARLRWSCFEPQQIGCLLRSAGVREQAGGGEAEAKGERVWVGVEGVEVADEAAEGAERRKEGVGTYYKLSDMAAGVKPYDAMLIVGGAGYVVCRWAAGKAAGYVWAFEIGQVSWLLKEGGAGIRGDEAGALASWRIRC